MTIHTSKPGKLYLAGEYAVLSGRSKAIIIQTKAKMHVTIKADTVFRISDRNRQLLLVFSSFDEMMSQLRASYLKEAIMFCHRYLDTLGSLMKPYHLSISSDLKIEGLEKLGLGSSAALTVAAIDAILKFHDVILEPLALYKAGVLTQIDTYPHSSFGDIACSAFDHAITYQKFDLEWLKEKHHLPLDQLILKDWPNLEIAYLDMPKLPIVFIYTNQPANSQVLVKTIESQTETPFYEAWINQTGLYVNDMITHLKSRNIDGLMTNISDLNEGLKSLAHHTKTALFTKTMETIETMVNEAHGVFKFSGAGGGDCVIALFKHDEDLTVFKTFIKDKYHIINDMIEGLN